eukprot:EG_transcript_29005
MADSKCICNVLPPQCLAGALIGAGTVAAVALAHDEKSKVPRTCVVSSLAGLGAAAVSFAHHTKHAKEPPRWYCVAGAVGGAAGVALAWRAHRARHAADGAKPMPLSCWASTAVGLAAVVAGTLLLTRK